MSVIPAGPSPLERSTLRSCVHFVSIPEARTFSAKPTRCRNSTTSASEVHRQPTTQQRVRVDHGVFEIFELGIVVGIEIEIFEIGDTNTPGAATVPVPRQRQAGEVRPPGRAVRVRRRRNE